MNVSRLLSRRWTGYLGALLFTAAVTGLVALVRAVADVSNVSMLYLLAVLATAAAFGVGPAILASIASFLAFNFFFLQPRHTFTVSNDEEWVALALLLVTGVVTGQLAGSLSDRARDAERREREAVVLYDIVRLMSEPDLARALTAIAERVRIDLRLAAVVITFGTEAPRQAQAEAGDPEAVRLANAASPMVSGILGRGHEPSTTVGGAPGRWIRIVPPRAPTAKDGNPDWRRVRKVPVNLHGQPVGAILLVAGERAAAFTAVEDRLLSAIANQLGLALQRIRLAQEATEVEALRRTDELRTALINAVSHDFRTPLASIIASSGSLLQRDVEWTEGERREFAEAIEVEAERLNRLVGNLLDLSRIEAGSLRPEKGWYDLGSLIQEVAGRLRHLAAAHRLSLNVPDDLPPVDFDYVEIDQALSNLIENAVKHTPPGTEVVVSVRVSGQAAEVDVADHGPGIPAAALPHLFDAFFRSPSEGVSPKGSGLGLAVARGLIEAHGGRIWAENRPGGGARFVFTLPLGTATPPSSSASEALT